MIIIHGVNRFLVPRLASQSLTDRMKVMPAVIVTGARQTGKSTLARELMEGRRYLTLDDYDVLHAARTDPEVLVGGTEPVTLDEVQRAPELLLAVKRQIDLERTPGQFLLTGSANLLLQQNVSESLAGRASYLTLRPLTRSEQLGQGRAGFWEELVAAADKEWPDVLAHGGQKADWHELALHGGFPTPAVTLTSSSERAIWFDGYVRTYLERDLQDLANISNLADFQRLMRLSALRVGQIVNQSELALKIGISQPTVHRWLNLLETSFLLQRLPPFTLNRSRRLIKSPRLYWGDTGVALFLTGAEELAGVHLENVILNDLLAWSDVRIQPTGLSYWRTTDGDEVDFVIETAGQLIPIEVKSGGKPRLRDARHLLAFQAEYSGMSRTGLLLHNGDDMGWLTPSVLAVPWWRVL